MLRDETAKISPERLGDLISAIGKPTAASVLQRAASTGRPALQPRCGVGHHGDMRRLLQEIESQGAPDLLTLTIDSYTRLGQFDRAAKMLAEAPEQLNGYPLVTHGAARGRDLNAAVSAPLDVRHGSPEADDLLETALGAGITAFEGGAITYALPYSKEVPLSRAMRSWARVDRRCAEMADAGVTIAREMFGTLTAVLVPPCLALTLALLDGLRAVRAGVRCLLIAYPQCGALGQDIAALRAIPVLAKRYLPADVTVHPVLHQFMGPFPQDSARAQALIVLGGLVGRAGGAHKIVTKTYAEAVGIPDAGVNAHGLRLTRSACAKMFDGVLPRGEDVAAERDLLETEVAELLDPVVDSRDLDAAILDAFANGRLDVPFSPNTSAWGRVIPGRDAKGAVRLVDASALPLSSSTRARHIELLADADAPERRLEHLLSAIEYFRDEREGFR